VQVAWVGYAGTRGLEEIDYFLTDWYHTPKDFEQHFTEKVLRMPDDYVTYYPPDIPIKKEERPFTYIAPHNPAKINEQVLAVWGRVLQKSPAARLLMAYSGMKSNERRIRETLDTYGIDRERVEIHDRVTHNEMMNMYNRADLTLDTFPYASGLVACESLWMGVPVVTLPNKMFSGRHALSHLMNLDMDEFICYSEGEYIKKAVEFSKKPQNEFLPMYIRENMTMSPLLNYELFSHNFNSRMWEVWK
jgi:predicted O-linked N-acetylglucosamine transferase (SPINDLY family)